MKITIGLVALCVLMSCPAAAQQSGFQDALVDRMAGEWVMRGTISDVESTHDIVAEWVLEHQYLRFHEVSRETSDDGIPLYEAIVFIGWDQPSSRYACLWLDSTGGGGLSAQAIGHAKRGGDEMAFLFTVGDGSFFHTTFSYNRDNDTWQWQMDWESDGDRKPFARVTLTRRD